MIHGVDSDSLPTALAAIATSLAPTCPTFPFAQPHRFEPKWSASMRAKLEDPGLPRNVRLLVFQFALNQPVTAALEPWAERWIVAMANFALAPLPEGLRWRFRVFYFRISLVRWCSCR